MFHQNSISTRILEKTMKTVDFFSVKMCTFANVSLKQYSQLISWSLCFALSMSDRIMTLAADNYAIRPQQVNHRNRQHRATLDILQ